jgi:AbrB family looped-hinge helix DNA binding protein
MNTTLENESSLVQYLMTGRLSEKGQLVLPKEFRDEQGLEAGSPIAILKIGNSLLLLPEMDKFNTLCQRIERTLQKAGVEADELLETLPETRREVFRKLYPELAENESEL